MLIGGFSGANSFFPDIGEGVQRYACPEGLPMTGFSPHLTILGAPSYVSLRIGSQRAFRPKPPRN